MEENYLDSDHPRSSINQDELGRKDFVLSLAKRIKYADTSRGSLTIGLYGEWGSGKTSVVNMVREELEKNSRYIIFEYNPWELADQNMIFDSFFKSLTKKLESYSYGTLDNGLKGLRTLNKVLKKSTSTFYNLSLILSSIFSAVTFFSTPIYMLIKSIFGLADETSKTIDKITDMDKDKTLAEIKKSLGNDLQNSNRKILIIIDDMDRLTKEQTRTIIQLIKANADFKNVVYLLPFQKGIVEKNIEEGDISGSDYLEKIINVGIDLPAINRNKLDDYFYEQLHRFLDKPENKPIKDNIGHDDLNLLLNYYGLSNLLSNLRDIKRFISAFSLNSTMFINNGSYEVNTIELITIETIRLIEHEVYIRIGSNKKLLTWGKHSGSNEGYPIEKATIEEIISCSSEKNRTIIKEIIQKLFPIAKKYLRENSIVSHSSNLSDHKISNPNVFERYFTYNLDENDVPKYMIDKFIGSSNNEEELKEMLLEILEEKYFVQTLECIKEKTEEIPKENYKSFIKSLIFIGDILDGELGRHRSQLIKAIENYIRHHWGTLEERNRILSEVMEDTGYSVTSINIIRNEISTPDSFSDAILTTEYKEQYIDKWVANNIEKAKEDIEKFLTQPHISFLLYQWKEFGNPKPILTERITTNEQKLMLLDILCQRRTDFNHIDPKYVENFYPFENLKNLIEIDSSKVSDNDKILIETLKTAVAELENN